jgi:mono/diheme cytochrome c family protein
MRERCRILLPSALILLGPLVAALTAGAQGMRPPLPQATKPPFELSDANAVAAGAKLFQQNCTGYCHGKEGRLARAPQLRARADFTPEYLYARISNGFPPMPSYSSLLGSEDIWKLVAYLISLKDVKE